MKPVVPSRADHLAMMRSPERWPHRPLLCLKRGDFATTLECGVLLETLLPGQPFTVLPWAFDRMSPYEALTDTRKPPYLYPDLDAVLADGWEVD